MGHDAGGEIMGPPKEEIELLEKVGKEIAELGKKHHDLTLIIRISHALLSTSIKSFVTFELWEELEIAANLIAQLFNEINNVDFPEQPGG